nr:uncharacterized protein LOC120962070 [Aegilops tauschii subsp. strangulata]
METHLHMPCHGVRRTVRTEVKYETLFLLRDIIPNEDVGVTTIENTLVHSFNLCHSRGGWLANGDGGVDPVPRWATLAIGGSFPSLPLDVPSWADLATGGILVVSSPAVGLPGRTSPVLRLDAGRANLQNTMSGLGMLDRSQLVDY